MKEYFSHDYNARNDTKLVKLFMKRKLEGIGAYWCIIEMLYEEGGYLLRSEYERIAFELRTNNELIKDIIENYGLFEIDDLKLWSNTAMARLKKRIEKSEKARVSVKKRWDKYERNTNVKEMKSECNTSKVKESKVKVVEENKNTVIDSAPQLKKLLDELQQQQIDEMKEFTLYSGNFEELKQKFCVEFIGRYGLNKTFNEALEALRSWMHKDKGFSKVETKNTNQLSPLELAAKKTKEKLKKNE